MYRIDARRTGNGAASPVKQHQTSALAVTTAVAAEDEPLDDPSIVSQDPVAIVSDDDIYTVVDSIVIDEVDAPGLLIDSNGGRAQVLGGDIETSGDNSEGLRLEAAGDYADLGEVVTHGDGSTGVYAGPKVRPLPLLMAMAPTRSVQPMSERLR